MFPPPTRPEGLDMYSSFDFCCVMPEARPRPVLRENGVKFWKRVPAGAKARPYFVLFAARLKSCPDTKRFPNRVFPQPVKSCPFTKHFPNRVFWNLKSNFYWMAAYRLAFRVLCVNRGSTKKPVAEAGLIARRHSGA